MSLAVALTRSDSAMSLETGIKAKGIADQPTSTVTTFDELYRDWHKDHSENNRWTNAQAEDRPIRSYEIHAEKHIGSMPIDKIRKPAIKAFMQPVFKTAPKQAALLLGCI